MQLEKCPEPNCQIAAQPIWTEGSVWKIERQLKKYPKGPGVRSSLKTAVKYPDTLDFFFLLDFFLLLTLPTKKKDAGSDKGLPAPICLSC